MPLSGVHVACGYAGAKNYSNADTPILGECVWSQTMTSAGTTSQGAPGADRERGEAVFSIDTSVEIYFAIGPSPDATSGPRRYLKAGDHFDVYAKLGDRLSWVSA